MSFGGGGYDTFGGQPDFAPVGGGGGGGGFGGGGGGGGFDAGFGGGDGFGQPFGGGGGGGGAPGGFGGEGSPAKASKPQTMTSLTLKQIKNSLKLPDESFQVDGKSLHQVSVVAFVRSFAKTSMNIVMDLDDGTAVMGAKMWVDQPAAGASATAATAPATDPHAFLGEGVCVRLFGKVTEYEGKRNVMMYRVEPVEDHNELTFHLLDALTTHVFNTRAGDASAAAGAGAGAGASAAFGAAPVAGGFTDAAFGGGAAPLADTGFGVPPGQVPGSADAPPTDLENRVIEIVKQAGATQTQGVALAYICNNVNLPEEQVRPVCDTLCAKAMIYSTVNDTTFQTVDR